MVIETFKPGQTDAVYERFAQQGRLLPRGLNYLASWLARDRRRCFQLMETERPELFEDWVARWRDLVDFEIIPVEPSPAGEKEPSKGPVTRGGIIVGRENTS